MDYNICIIKPDGYIHSLAFLELGELIRYSLKDLGYDATAQLNKMEKDCKNIVIGCHLLDPKLIPQLPKSTIILNTEQVFSDTTWWNTRIFEWVKRFEVWDYSDRNISKFEELGVRSIKHLRLGFQKELVRIIQTDKQDIEILFYGSINERRAKIIKQLEARGLLVKYAFGIYGEERDKLIARSKVVLNHHFYSSQIFEIVRVFYLLTNSVAVVAEVNEQTSIDSMYLNGIYSAPYDGLVEACVKVVEDEGLRKELKVKAFNTISQFPQSRFTAKLLLT